MNYVAPVKLLDCVALIDSKGGPDAYHKARKAHRGLKHFSFTIGHDNLVGDLLKATSESQEDYSERLRYCILNMKHDIFSK